MFGRATITLCIGPHSSSFISCIKYQQPNTVPARAAGRLSTTIKISDYLLFNRSTSWYGRPVCGIGQTIIFSSCGFFLSIYLFSSPNLSGRTLDVYRTSTHGVALVRI